jgi:hypothetical protein
MMIVPASRHPNVKLLYRSFIALLKIISIHDSSPVSAPLYLVLVKISSGGFALAGQAPLFLAQPFLFF